MNMQKQIWYLRSTKTGLTTKYIHEALVCEFEEELQATLMILTAAQHEIKQLKNRVKILDKANLNLLNENKNLKIANAGKALEYFYGSGSNTKE